MTPQPIPTAHLDGTTKQALETGRNRLLMGGALFAVAFTAIAFRLTDVAVVKPTGEPHIAQTTGTPAFTAGRNSGSTRDSILAASRGSSTWRGLA